MRSRKLSVFNIFVLAFLISASVEVSGGTLTGSFSPIASGSNVNVSAVGKLDWVHWGLYTDTSLNRKACAVPQISNFKVIGDSNAFLAAYQFANHANGYTWLDGDPVANVTNTTTGVWAYGFPNLNSGFEIEVPADTTTRVLQVFVGVYKGRGTLRATLSDGSAPAYQDSSLMNSFGNGPGGVYTITFAANSAGRKLRVQWYLSQLGFGNPSDANVTLQAAALTQSGANNPPFATLTNPLHNATFTEPADLTLNATALDLDGTITNVAFYAGATKLGQSSTAPYSLNWNNVPRGCYEISVEATDNLGVTSCRRPIEIFVYGNSGSQTNALAHSPSSVDLTTAGGGDWTHWGLLTNTSFNYKSGVIRQISNFTALGTNAIARYTNNYTVFSWSDGTPEATPGTNGSTGVFVGGIKNGFRLTAPANGSSRRLTLYVGGYGMHSEFRAYLSDLSAKPFIDQSVSNVYGSSYVFYTVDYASATEGQQLIVEYRSVNLFDLTYGNVTLQAATLQGPPPLHILNPARIGNDFVMSFPSVSGREYVVQWANALPASSWTDMITVMGNGALMTVTNYNVPAGERYYRVQVR